MCIRDSYILSRIKYKDQIVDNGYYVVNIEHVDGARQKNFGKLSSVLKLIDDEWQFDLDVNATSSKEEFSSAKLRKLK